MSFLKVGKAPAKDRRLYCMRITTSEEVYYKFGVASGHSAKERLLQIAGSYFDKYRETPIIKIMRDQKIDPELVFKYETILHRFFKHYCYDSHMYKAFDGSSECFTIDKDTAIQAYEAVLNGMEPGFTFYKECDKIPF